MDRTERDKICKTCINHKNDERYGIICGLTDNLANFNGNCRDYSKAQKRITSNHSTTETKVTKRKEKKSFGSVIGTGVIIWIVFKLVLKVIRGLSE